MAQWRKVITSGSTANLAALQVDNLTSGQVVIGGGTGNLSTTAINGGGNIVATTGSTGLSHSGSFSGSFQGLLTGTASTASYVNGNIFTGTNVATSASYAITASYALAAAAPNTLNQGTGITTFSYNGGTPGVTVSVSGASTLNTNAVTKWTGTAFANSNIFDDGTNIQITGSSIVVSGSLTTLRVTGSISSTGGLTGSLLGTASYVTGSIFAGSNQATSASYATTAGQTVASVTAGAGLTGTTFNGSAASTFDVVAGALITVAADFVQVATSSLVANQIPKFANNTLSGSNISDDGTTVTISKATTISAGGISVTGNSTFSNNLTVQGDLSVAGTASFTNTQNLLVGDRFVAIASGSTTLTDGGIIVVGSTTAAAGMSGSAFYLEVGTGTDTGQYGRFAVAPNTHVSASIAVVDEWVVTAKQSSTAPGASTPTWGGNTNNAAGNMWIDTTAGNIYIWA